MDLKSFATVSGQIILADIYPAFAKLEGEIDHDKRVWVIVRQAREEDSIARAALLAKREMKQTIGARAAVSISEIVDDNPRERFKYEVYWTLTDVGNLMDGDKPHFTKMPARDMPFGEFEKLWGALPQDVALAIHKAVRQFNPPWYWEAGEV